MKKTNENKLSDIVNLCIFCGSKSGMDPDFEKYAKYAENLRPRQGVEARIEEKSSKIEIFTFGRLQKRILMGV